MSTPLFYLPQPAPGQKEISLDEETSRHVVQVLRMKPGEPIEVTDGKGHTVTGKIIDANKKETRVAVGSISTESPDPVKTAVAVSLLKNRARFEWFLEKATELGVGAIIPMISERTEKEKFRFDRMEAICISAMLQSQQAWLPALHEPKTYEEVLSLNYDLKLIAHCNDGEKEKIKNVVDHNKSRIIVIGPEGDFSVTEVDDALKMGFIPVTLGKNRLRTETAALMGVMMLVNW